MVEVETRLKERPHGGRPEAPIRLDQVRCECGRVVGYLFSLDKQPGRKLCAECIRKQRQGKIVNENTNSQR